MFDPDSNAESGRTDDDKFQNAVKAVVLERKNKNIKASNTRQDKSGKVKPMKKMLTLADLPSNVGNPAEVPSDAPTFYHYAKNNLFGDALSVVAKSTVESRVLEDPNLSSLDDSDADEEEKEKWKEQKKQMSRTHQRMREKKLREQEAQAASKKQKLLLTGKTNNLALQKADAATLHAQAASDLAASNRNAARLAALDAAKGILPDGEYNALMLRTVKDLFATNERNERKRRMFEDTSDEENNDVRNGSTPGEQAKQTSNQTNTFNTPARDPYVHGTVSCGEDSSPELTLIGIKEGVRRRAKNRAKALSSAEKNNGVHEACCVGEAFCGRYRNAKASLLTLDEADRYCTICHKMAHYCCATFSYKNQADICHKCFDEKW